jgi:hypothetical protein
VGIYGPMLHKGQVQLGNPMKALLCVGVAYFAIGVIVPLVALSSAGGIGSFNGGATWAGLGGALGAIGAVCIIYSFRNGGSPGIVMPLVFGGAPLINVLVSMAMHPPKTPRIRCCTSATPSQSPAAVWCCTTSRSRP